MLPKDSRRQTVATRLPFFRHQDGNGDFDGAVELPSFAGDEAWSSVRGHLPAIRRRPFGGGDDREPKRLRFDDTIDEKLVAVRDAVSSLYGRTEESCTMLEQMCAGALGPGMDERDDDQNQCVEMIGRAIEELKNRLLRQAEAREDYKSNPEKAKAEIQAAVYAYQDKVAISEKNVAIKHKTLRESKGILAAASAELEAAIASHEHAKRELQSLEAELDDLQDKNAEHFIPIKLGSWKTNHEKMKHLTELLPLFKKFEYEDSLIAAFQKAADHKPDDRGRFDQVTMQSAEKDFADGIHRLESTIKAQEPVVSRAEDGVKCADDAREQAARREREAAIELGAAIQERRQHQLHKDEVQKAYDEFPRDEKALQHMLDASRQSLVEFSNGPLQAYIYLRDRVAALAL